MLSKIHVLIWTPPGQTAQACATELSRHHLYVVEPTTPHTHTVILLHGLGSRGEELARVLLDDDAPSTGLKMAEMLPGTKFIFPTARRRRSKAFGRSVINQ